MPIEFLVSFIWAQGVRLSWLSLKVCLPALFLLAKRPRVVAADWK
jgi:hypothetical protein